MKVLFSPRAVLMLLVLSCVAFSQAEEWEVTYPEQFPPVPWLQTHQRACFAVEDDKIAGAADDGVNVMIGGTNAGGPYGFVGGHWVLNKAGDDFVAVLTGEPAK